MSKKKTVKIEKAVTRMQNYTAIDVPFYVWRLLPENVQSSFLEISADQAGIGGDFANLEDWRTALDWLCDQFGGTVTWRE